MLSLQQWTDETDNYASFKMNMMKASSKQHTVQLLGLLVI